MLTRDEIKAIILGTPASEIRSILGEIEDEQGLDLTPVRVEMFRAAPAYGGAPFRDMDVQYVVELQVIPENRLPVVLVIRQTLGLGLGEALDLVKRAPQVIKRFDYEYEAKALVEKFRSAGATAALLQETA
jgi:large subunit ribosomal protein L7/L12